MPDRTARSAEILEGRIQQVRVAVPLVRGNIRLLVDGTPVFGTIEDAAQIRTLRNLQHQRTPVRVGVLTDSKQTPHFSWLIAPKKPGVPPRFYVDERRMTWRMILIGLAIAAVAGGIAVLLGVSSAWRAIALAVLLAVALAGLVFAGVSLRALWQNRLIRTAILQSEALYRSDDGRPAKAAPVRDSPTASAPLDASTATDEEQPQILRISGVIQSPTYELRRAHNSQQSYGIYRFVIGKQAYVMTAGENLGKVLPFLAEGDRVELAAYAGENPADAERRLVYALRNLEDGRVYVCHHIFRGGDAKIAPIGVGMTQRSPMLKLVGGFMVITWLMLVGVFYFGSPRDHEDLPALAAYAFVGLFAIWVCCAMPFVYLDRRWRAGRPTRRQRILARIYAALDLGTPFAPTAKVEEV